jgi:hypothetical protein
MGAYPRAPEWAVAGGAAPSPHARAFDTHRLPRIQAVEGEITRWLDHCDRHPEERYVSDGDPRTITIQRGSAGRLRTGLGAGVVERPAGGATGR